jgi:hypothetical protein
MNRCSFFRAVGALRFALTASPVFARPTTTLQRDRGTMILAGSGVNSVDPELPDPV